MKLPLNLHSSENQGSDFSVSVPIVENDSRLEQPKVLPIPGEHQTGANKNQLILCIDNEQDILDGMQALLTSWGYQKVVTSLDGEAFSQQLGQLDNLALILADYHLDHDRTGIQVIKKLRQQANWDIPSVVITADQTDRIK